MANVRAETSHSHCHSFFFKFSQFTGQFEQFQCFFQRHTFDGLIGTKRCKNRFFFFFRSTDLSYRTIFTNFYRNLTTGFWICSKNAFAYLAFRIFEGTFNYRMEFFIEIVDGFSPFNFSFGYVVKFNFHISREIIIHNVRKVFNQKVVDHQTNIGWEKL